MLARKNVLSLLLSFFVSQAIGQGRASESDSIQVDVTSPDSIKSAAQQLASGIITAYNQSLAGEDGVTGLFEGLDDSVYFWEAGTIWNAMLGYSYLTGDSKYDSMISEALQFQVGDYRAYMPPNQTKTMGNDDQSCWGLAAMTAAEIGLAKPKDGEWVDLATNVWQVQSERFKHEEETNNCGGGLRWQVLTFNTGYNYKNTWSNGNFFLLSARLAKFTGNATYSQWADKTFKWSQDVGLVDENFRVYDGTDALKDCKEIQKVQWSATLGLYTEGAALMYNLTGAQNYTDAVKGFVNSSSVFESTKGSSVLLESACEKSGKCDNDMRAYKGVFGRTFARAALAAPFASDSINKILTNSAKAAGLACTAGQDPECSLSWDPDTDWNAFTATEGNIGEVYAALEMIQGLLYPTAKGLKSAKGAGGASGPANSAGNSTQSAGASGASGAGAPQNTGAAGSVAASMAAVLATAAAAVLSC